MRNFFKSKTNVIGLFLLIVSIILVIVLKGTFMEWATFSALVFGAITGRNITNTLQESKNAKVETKNVQ